MKEVGAKRPSESYAAEPLRESPEKQSVEGFRRNTRLL
jgi:hypothetical protein